MNSTQIIVLSNKNCMLFTIILLKKPQIFNIILLKIKIYFIYQIKIYVVRNTILIL